MTPTAQYPASCMTSPSVGTVGGMQGPSVSVANLARPHQVLGFQSSVLVATPLARLGVRPVNRAPIDIEVWWNEATAVFSTLPEAARRSILGVGVLLP